ncbi:DNA processing protein [Deinococcus metalli]|uniref:DNA processing protein n=1 Tax=Deinococcus metalli TaxID=1141878 RepID=A0A7W8KHS5_9DEIO|nr:DNA-processing protein DprA [Deinococcus metalli]MBB5378417.1 DNA processing protein [Deinococcus metalli]GHF59114.1 DNA-binding protein [Deinococcus metalli]
MTSSQPAPGDRTAELLALLTLRFTPQLGPRRIEALRRHFGTARQALSAPLGALRAVPGLDARSVAAVGNEKAAAQARTELDRAAEAGVTVLGRGLDGYPAALDALGDPPPVLWVSGPLPGFPAVPRAVGIVGTRAASPHALALARQIASDLARADVVVVSGLARGIDTAAHTATLDAGGQTVGVLGSGVNHIYPGENAPLSRRMTVVSEYALGTPPAQHHFPTRNRVIAALSAGSLVVEGELKSGSMITATHALECGRTVFAVPGRAGDPRAAGPHRLLREGAVLTESAQDILDELGWGTVTAAPRPDLPPEQERVYAALTTPMTLDDLQAACGLALPELQTALLMLQLQGLVEETGGRWARR